MAEFNEIVVDEEIAQADAQKFIKARRIKPVKLKRLKEQGEWLIDGIMYGIFELIEDSKHNSVSIKQNLYEPLKDTEGNVVKEAIVYKSRIQTLHVENALKKTDDSVGQTRNVIGAVTDIGGSEVAKRLDYSDYEMASVIASYFL